MAKKKASKKKTYASKTVSQNAKSASITDSINTEVIAEALSSVNQSILLKLCRLCENKDGPFLNIFDADKIIARKIDELMPFGIEENDELPHKICFRCSAKVEELYDFVQKCIKTQDSLRKAMGNITPISKVKKNRTLWEEKLKKSNMSNDDICNALIKKAMEGIKDIPLSPIDEEDDETDSHRDFKSDNIVKDKKADCRKENVEEKKDDESMSLRQIKMLNNKIDQKISSTRTSPSSNIQLLVESKRTKPVLSDDDDDDDDNTSILKKYMTSEKSHRQSTELKEPPPSELQKKEKKPVRDNQKPFDIMDHVSMIKVNGVGVLFQCKLCNRNFLKKEVVMSHACAKNGGHKKELTPEFLPPNPPKLPVVKYINTKTDSLHPKSAVVNEKPIVLDDEPTPSPPRKSKPKAGPASKVKRNYDDTEKPDPSSSNQIKIGKNATSQIANLTIQIPNMPSLNSRYKILPGPNNTYTLVDEKVFENTEYVSSDDSNSGSVKNDKGKRRSESISTQNESLGSSKKVKLNGPFVTSDKCTEEKRTSSDRPYPVGLIKKVGNHSNDYTPPVSDSVAFTTPAMKKQSYTIVQTGNPSKLLISTKPQPVQEEASRKKIKKGPQEIREEPSKQPTLGMSDDATRQKDPAFFTFINVDPLLQPSYVLPTDNIIQESQISTSTPINNTPARTENKYMDNDNSKYKCNMCGEQFSREKKLFTHINSHYSKMDEEDELREKVKKRQKKS